jgi:homoprotocatechuate degradation regulator HpaR
MSTLPQFSQSLPMLLYAAIDAVMPRFRRIFREAGITEQQWRVLRVLWDIVEISHSDLARLTLIAAPSLIGVVDRLAAMQLVGRRRSNLDRRVVLISSTPQGRKLRDQVLPAVQQMYFELKGSLDEDTWRHLMNGLNRLVGDSR